MGKINMFSDSQLCWRLYGFKFERKYMSLHAFEIELKIFLSFH